MAVIFTVQSILVSYNTRRPQCNNINNQLSTISKKPRNGHPVWRIIYTLIHSECISAWKCFYGVPFFSTMKLHFMFFRQYYSKWIPLNYSCSDVFLLSKHHTMLCEKHSPENWLFHMQASANSLSLARGLKYLLPYSSLLLKNMF